MKQYRYFDILLGIFVAVLLISNTTSTKILKLSFLTFDGGTLLFPVSYIFGDILTEVYGYRRSRRVIWTGFFCLLVMVVFYALVGYLPAAGEWQHQAAYMAILGIVPRISLASLIAYFAGEFSNSYVLARMKIWTEGRWLWTRTISSTLVGEGIDTLLFVIIAFAGILPPSLLASVMLSNYVFKVGIEVILTPLTYRLVKFLKVKEQEDFYDRNTNFNPFALNRRQAAGESD